MAALWNSCGGLGGNARFTMVSRGPSPQFFLMKTLKEQIAELRAVGLHCGGCLWYDSRQMKRCTSDEIADALRGESL